MKLKLLTPFILVIVLFSFSCGNYKNVPYFQDLKQDAITKEDITNYSPLIIQTGDILGINVSSLNPEASDVFNYNLNRVSGDNVDRSPQNSVIGYLVDQNGNIRLPLIGETKVAGFSTTELNNLLEAKLQTYLSKPIVNIRILNFKISILGDVQKPDSYTIQNEHISIPEALSLAGDLTITGQRNILLIREVDGKRQFIPLDLNSRKIFESPYYYLKNNDVIYVTPNKQKVSAASTDFQKVSLVIAALSVVAIVLSSSNILK